MTETDAEFDAAMESVVRETGVARYRYLCRDHPDPAVRVAFRGLVARLARGEPPAVSYGDPGPAAPCGGCPGAIVA